MGDDTRMRMNGVRRWLIGAGAVALLVFLLVGVDSDPSPGEGDVERRLRAIASSSDFRVHEVRCFRDDVLERSFVCLVGGPDDLHLALDVRWLANGGLALRRPDGSPFRF